MFAGLSLTGIGLYLTLPASLDDFPHPLQGEFRIWHGFFVFLSLISIGQIYQEHIRKQLKKWQKYPDGLAHLALWLIIIWSGFLLYYPPLWLDELINMSSVHWYSSLGLLVMLPAHALFHKPKKKSTAS